MASLRIAPLVAGLTMAFAGPFALAAPAPAAVAVQKTASAAAMIDWRDQRQSIDGFGASSEYFTRDFAAYPRDERDRVLDVLFNTKTGAGLSIIRSRIWDGGCDGPDTRCGLKPSPLSHNPAPGVWAFDCASDDRSGRCAPGKPRDEWQIWFAHQAKRRAGDLKFLFSVWSPPGWMKDTGRPDNGGRLLKQHYAHYADYLSRNLREYATRYDIKADVISVQNEPALVTPGATALWSPEEMRDFVKDHLGPKLKAGKLQTQIMVAEDQFWGEESAAATLGDPEAAKYVGVFGGHNYNWGKTPFGGVARPIDLKAAAGRPLWMTEVCRHGEGVPFDPSIDDALGWAKSIHEFMTVPEASAWLYWRFQRPGGPDSKSWPNGGKEALINMVPETRRIEIAKRLWAMGNYSRFVRPGFVRVTATATPTEGVHLSAYRNTKSRSAAPDAAVIVAINEQSTPVWIDVKGALSLKTAYRTSAQEDLAAVATLPAQRSAGGYRLQLAPRSITTFVGRVS